MQLLKELLNLHEAPEVPVELRKLVDAFPKHHGKAIEKLWGTQRLVWHGMRFFDHDELGEAYTKSEEAVEEAMDVEDFKIERSIHLDASQLLAKMHGDEEDDDTEHGDGDAEIEWTVELKYSDMQECYLGYSPKRDRLYIGYDAHGDNEEAFNQAFDEAFEKATGVPYDHEDEDHAELFDEVWQEYLRENGSYGLVFEITDHDGSFSAEADMEPMSGGFYRGTYKVFKRQNQDVVDLRLD